MVRLRGGLHREVHVNRRACARLAVAALVVGCSSRDPTSPVSLDGGQALRHDVLDFSVALAVDLVEEGWHFQAGETSRKDRTYSFYLLPPGVQSFEPPASVREHPLPLQVYAQLLNAAPAPDPASWADDLKSALQFRILSSPERLLVSPLLVRGYEGRELVMVGLHDAEPRREYFFAARVDGPRTVVEFRGGMSSSVSPDSTAALEANALADRQFEQILGPYRTIVGSLRFTR